MTSLGPVPFTVLILLAAWAVGTAAGQWRLRGAPAPKPAIGGALFDVALVGLVVARLAFIVAWWPLYAADPWAMLRPGDGGYLPIVGVMAALAFAGWRAWRAPELRRPLVAGLGSAALAGTDWDDRLAFAGEATSTDHPSTVHGAWLSGLAAADALVG